jgi:purine-binding chemotaxis protein CheW
MSKGTTTEQAQPAPEESRLVGMRQKLDAIQAAITRSLDQTREDKARILKERAREMARKAEAAAKSEATLQVVDFTLADEHHAVELVHVREVYPLRNLTPLPCTPSFVMGVVNIRSQIVSVVDLKVFFDLPGTGQQAGQQIIILSSKDMEFGIVADSILGVRGIPVSTIQATLPTLTGLRAGFLRGVTGDRVVILDGAKILAAPDIIVHREAGAQAP